MIHQQSPRRSKRTAHAGQRFLICVRCCFLALCFVVLLVNSAFAQKKESSTPKKLPSAEKIVDNYLKAIGGKKAIAALKDSTYEWTVQIKNEPVGTARSLRKPPSAERSEMMFGNGSIISGTSASSAWELGLDKELRTLTGAEGATAKLHAALNASHLLNYKKLNVLARVVSLGDLASEPAYIVEFSTRSGAKLQYYFSVQTSLITKVADEVHKSRAWYEDYRTEKGILEAHRLRLSAGSGDLTFILRSVTYNSGVEDRQFDPPVTSEALDVAGLLREVGKNQDEVEKHVTEYAFTQKETDREINSKGELKKETVKVYEVFPIANREPIQKLISENGVQL
ncbi:MAG TPA: hypothetical protein VGQ39_24365 [Pyrinomonadaceae bacterium]|jgi:hypothetical protein|nr:hypothetical protein [Pyrinomonadaceae bacterium]